MDYVESPKITIGFAVFLWEPIDRNLIQLKNRYNYIPVPDLPANEDFRIKLNNLTMNIADKNTYRPEDYEHLREYRIPSEFLALRQTPSDELVSRLNRLSEENDYGIMVIDAALNRRLTGKLPVIDIAGDKFYVDLRLQELRATDDFTVTLKLDDFEANENDDGLLFYYNKTTRKMEDISPDITELPKNVVLAEIPGQLGLDPMVVSREFIGDETHFLREHPMPKNLKAKITPAEDTYLAVMIAENLKKQESQQRGNDETPGIKR